MKQIKKDQDESISNTAKLLQQLGNTEIKIAANIAGTLDIVATSLSPEAVSSLKDEIIYSVSKIIDARIKGQDTPQPPSIDQRRLSSNLNRQAER